MKRPFCKTEGCINPCKTNGLTKEGVRKYQRKCSSCCKRSHRQFKPCKIITYKLRSSIKKYGDYTKEDHCQACGFIAEQSCQLDVDHINGDHTDNSVCNLQTLCSNCHRLKTYYNRDYIQKNPK